jgi:hypothetical protein
MQEKTKREKADIEETQEEGGLSDDQLEAAAGGNVSTRGAADPRDYENANQGANGGQEGEDGTKDKIPLDEATKIFTDGFESGDHA